jgi:flavin reductase (DIM6/NTAB) family NADH-FMN oxidoreductase RutF
MIQTGSFRIVSYHSTLIYAGNQEITIFSQVMSIVGKLASLDFQGRRMYDDMEIGKEHMSVDPDELRKAMRQWATGVSVVATVFQGVRHGMTVNSFTSISLSPPLILVSLERTTRTHHLVEKSGILSVTILTGEQQDISDCFAGRHTEIEDRFANIETYTLSTGAPLIAGGLAGFDCRVVSTYEAGTHTLFIGEVVALLLPDPEPDVQRPLLYFNRTYRRLQK